MIRTPSDVFSLSVPPRLRSHLYKILASDSIFFAAADYSESICYWTNQYSDCYITSFELVTYCTYLADAYRSAVVSLGGEI